MPDGAGPPLPGWPRALREPLAAAYVGLSPSTFRQVVAPAVPAVRLTPGRIVWYREHLDRWLDQRPGAVVDAGAAPEDPPAREPHHDRDAYLQEALDRIAPRGAPRGRARRPQPAR